MYMLIVTGIILYCTFTLALRQCSLRDIRTQDCWANETCTAQGTSVDIGYCECQRGFQRINESLCIPVNKTAQQPSTSSLVHNTSSGHIAAAILIPLFIISLLIIAIYISHRYKLINWVRTRMNQRKRNYDEVMIGQDLDDDDDPPLH